MGFTEVTFLFVFLPVSILVYLIAESVFHKDKLNNVILVSPAIYQKHNKINSYSPIRGIIGAGKSRKTR